MTWFATAIFDERVDKDQGQGCESGIIVEVEENDGENDGSWMGWVGW